MSGMIYTDLPQFIKGTDEGFQAQEPYFELMSLILTSWFNNSFFYQPNLTNAQETLLLALPIQPPLGAHWFNTDLAKMRLLTAPGTIETVTST